jgi:hypothetical protein
MLSLRLVDGDSLDLQWRQTVVVDALSWDGLETIVEGTNLTAVCAEPQSLGGNLYKLGSNCFCIANRTSDSDTPQITSLLWAVSDGAARRVYFNDIEADDLATLPPPVELLPTATASGDQHILDSLKGINARGLMEHASYRIMSDGAFIHKTIEFTATAYHFRAQVMIANEPPYAIVWKLQQ